MNYPSDLKERIARVLSEILTDKYGDEYGVKVSLTFVPKEEVKEGIQKCG